jgi:hypothetical protein
MHNASEMCVHFCEDLGVLNDLHLWLLYENSIAYCSLRTRGSKSLSQLDVHMAATDLTDRLQVTTTGGKHQR